MIFQQIRCFLQALHCHHSGVVIATLDNDMGGQKGFAIDSENDKNEEKVRLKGKVEVMS